MNNEQNSTCTEAAPRNVQTRLSGLDREIALQAIAARATGTPVEAAYQILAGIEALDAGPESPLVMLWPKGDDYETLEDKAAWHEAERDRLIKSHEFYSRAFPSWRQQEPVDPGSCPLSRNAQDRSESPPTPLLEAASETVLDGARDKDPERSSLALPEESSDACGSDANAQA
jgi:hypothetical protein